MADFEASWRRRFDRAVEKYDTDHAVSGWSSEGLRRRLATFAAVFDRAALPPGLRVLDLGCGAGTYSTWLAERGHHVIAMDYSMATLQRTAQTSEVSRTSEVFDTPLRLIAGEAYHLPFASGVMDVVVCVGVLQTLDQPRAGLAEMRRVLAAGGLLFLMTLNAKDVAVRVTGMVRKRKADYEDLRRYDPNVLRQWLRRAGFAVEEIEPVYLLPEAASGLSRALDRRGVYRGLGRFGPAALNLAHAVLFVARAA